MAEKNVPGIPGACATRDSAYLVRCLWEGVSRAVTIALDQYLQGHWSMNLQWNCQNMAHLVISALQHVQLLMDSFAIRLRWILWWEGVSRAMTFDLDLFLQGHLLCNKTDELCHILSCLLYNTYRLIGFYPYFCTPRILIESTSQLTVYINGSLESIYSNVCFFISGAYLFILYYTWSVPIA